MWIRCKQSPAVCDAGLCRILCASENYVPDEKRVLQYRFVVTAMHYVCCFYFDDWRLPFSTNYRHTHHLIRIREFIWHEVRLPHLLYLRATVCDVLSSTALVVYSRRIVQLCFLCVCTHSDNVSRCVPRKTAVIVVHLLYEYIRLALSR